MAKAAAKHDPQTGEILEDEKLPAIQQGGAVAEFDPTMYEQEAGAGLSNIGMGDMSTPFLVVLQKGSPQCDETTGEYIEGAKQGMFFDTVSKEMFNRDTGIIVIPCGFASRQVEWKPRESGGGWVAEHPIDTPLLQTTKKNDKGQDVLPNGNLLVQTAYHYVMQIDPVTGSHKRAVIAMTSTQLKKSRRWNSLMVGKKLPRRDGMGTFTPPIYAYYYRLTTIPEQNEKGSWFGIDLQEGGLVNHREHHSEAKAYAEAVSRGEVRTTPPADQAPSTSGESGDRAF